MGRILVSSRMLLWCHYNPQSRTHRWMTQQQRRKTDHFLHTSQPCRGQNRKKCTITVSGNTQDAVYWMNLTRAQDTRLRFWQTRSHAIIVFSSLLADCIYKVISHKGERTQFERLSTPRPTPKIVLESAWQSQQQQQQQQDTSESASSSTRKLVQRVERGIR